MKKIPETVGERMAIQRRDVLKITQEELAKKLGVSRSLIGQIEMNYTMPNLALLSKFKEMSQSTYDYLIDGKL